LIAKLIGTFTVLAATAVAVAPTAAIAAEPTRAPAATPNGIIAILIGQVQAQPFTPPIGTAHGSFATSG
jgi:hypothetical protein